MSNYIYENNGDETLNKILLEIKKYTLKEDIFSPYMEKETFLYNHPALTAISKYAIKTDTFNFINSDYFEQLSTLPPELAQRFKKINEFDNSLDSFEEEEIEDPQYIKIEKHQNELKHMLDNLPNIIFFNSLGVDNHLNLSFLNIKNPIEKISDQDFLKILKENKIQSHKILKKEIDNAHNEDYDSVFSFSKKDKSFLINFKQKSLPNFINIFEKLIASDEKEEALHLSEFFCASVGDDSGQLSELGFSVLIHSLFSHTFEPYFLEPMVENIFNSHSITNSKRKILIDEASQFSTILLETVRNFVILDKPSNKKKNTP